MDKETAINLNLAIATFISFEEQLYNIKGIHGQQAKMYFNQMQRVVQRYEKEIRKKGEMLNDKTLDILSDAITDAIYIIRTEAIKTDESINNREGHSGRDPSEGDKPKE